MKYFLVGIISVLLSVGAMYLMRPKDNNALIEYQFKEGQRRLDSIEVKYKELERIDQLIYNRLNMKYEKIDSADKSELRDLFNNFGKRTNGHDLLRIK